MLINTQISCPVCPGKVIADTTKNMFTCQKCFIAYKDSRKMNSLLGIYSPKIIKISEESNENTKTSKTAI